MSGTQTILTWALAFAGRLSCSKLTSRIAKFENVRRKPITVSHIKVKFCCHCLHNPSIFATSEWKGIMTKIQLYTGHQFAAEALNHVREEIVTFQQGFDPESVGTKDGFFADPDRGHEFYNFMRRAWGKTEATRAHVAVGRLCEAHDVHVWQATVDTLSERGGAEGVRYIGGRIDQAICEACDHTWTVTGDLTARDACPACFAYAARPGIAWSNEFKQTVENFAADVERLETPELLVLAGFGEIDIFAGHLAEVAERSGVETLWIGVEPAFVKAEEPVHDDFVKWVDTFLSQS